MRPAETKSLEGIILPESDTPSPLLAVQGEVVAVGPDAAFRSGDKVSKRTRITPGAIVFFNKFDGYDIRHEGETYHIVKDKGILACVSG